MGATMGATTGRQPATAATATGTDHAGRRAAVVGALADAAGTIERAGPVRVAVDAVAGTAAATLADDLAATLAARGRRCWRASVDAAGLLDGQAPDLTPILAAPPDRGDRRGLLVVDGGFLQHPEFVGAWDLVIFVRGAGAHQHDRAAARYLAELDPEASAEVVVDLYDPAWPFIRRVDPAVAVRIGRDLHPAETRAFFAPRAATWELRFPDDDPAYAAAVADLGPCPGQVVVDLGCGTGRALRYLRDAVGPDGAVLGLDITPEMLATARDHGRDADAWLALADARRLPLRDAAVDAVFTAGLLPHLPDPAQALGELARVARPGGRLALFHPSGRAALAARHGRRLRDTDPLAPGTLRRLLERAGWLLDRYEDGPDRFLATAVRTLLPHGGEPGGPVSPHR
jgi:SAM-dependent methyltransferase